ncbi:uncharacterized protein LOC132611728 [Lycium barbarum]|uniref:uncharacterized protein LOC132611728 n=1 Tax=Lycium barbarum TaxID=112863 RepID=UPI00293E28EB|nr:uncharacterized protein LOC132611728 [Lycium barbarum]
MEHLQKVNGGLAFQKPTGENHVLGHVPGAILTAKSFEKPKCVKEWVEFLSHLNDDSMQWMFSWFPSEVLVFRTKIVPFLVLIGLRGLQPYAPLRVLRQSGRKQNTPLVADMNHYYVDYKEGKIPFAKEVIRMWKLKETTKADSVEPNRYQAGCEDNYVEWLAADLEESIKPGVSLKDRIKDGEAEACILLRQLRKKSLAATLPNLQSELEAAKAENLRLKVELADIVEKNRLLEADKAGIYRDNAHFISRLGELEATISQLRSELDSVKADAVRMAERHQQLKSESVNDKEKLRVVEQKAETRARISDKLKSKLEEAAEANNVLQAELESANQIQIVLLEERSKLETKFKKAEADLEETLKDVKTVDARSTILIDYERWKSQRVTLELVKKG